MVFELEFEEEEGEENNNKGNISKLWYLSSANS